MMLFFDVSAFGGDVTVLWPEHGVHGLRRYRCRMRDLTGTRERQRAGRSIVIVSPSPEGLITILSAADAVVEA